MKLLQLNELVITLIPENSNIRIKAADQNILIADQTEEQVAEILQHNYFFVYDFYKSKCIDCNFRQDDLNNISNISIAIVLYYLSMYNLWRLQYKKSNRYENLKFRVEDFSSPDTIDIIIRYYRKRFPDRWKEKSIELLDFSIEQLDAYWPERQKFYNK